MLPLNQIVVNEADKYNHTLLGTSLRFLCAYVEHLFVLAHFAGEYLKSIRKFGPFGQFSVILAMLPIGKSVREFKFTQCQCDNIEGQFYQ